jgi:exopolysaccharide biosynthesis polyprenyl glycosylphosphotransferase
VNEQRQAAFRRLTLLLDAVVLPVSMLVAYQLHLALMPYVPALRHPPEPSQYATLLYLTVSLFLVLIVLLQLHTLFERRPTKLEVLVDLSKLHVVGFLGLAGLLFATNSVLNRAIVFAFLGVNLPLMFVVRVLVMSYAEATFARGESRRAWLLVGDGSEGMARMVREAADEPWPPKVLGLLSEAPPATAGLPPHLGPPSKLGQVLHDGHVDLVIFFPPMHHPDAAGELLAACEKLGVPAAFAVDSVHRYPITPQVVTHGGTALITFDWVPPRPAAIAIKQAFDVLAAAVLLLLLSPLLLLAALAIRLSMGGPVLFGQERVGLHGRRFKLLKFRTMVMDAEARRAELDAKNEMSGPVFKMADDPRVTRLGRVLRRWSVDELPQLFNVLQGSMSLVGPRPLPVSEQQEIVGWYRRRLSMKPGITGLWQVSGRSEVDFDEWMKLDLRYVDQWSLRQDLRILLRTLPAVVSRRGAH